MKNAYWLFIFLIVGLSSNLFAQSDWDTYPVREIATLVKQEQDLKSKTPKSDIVVSADPFPSKTIVTYVGQKRSAGKYTRLFIKLWAETKGVPQNADMLVDEYLFKENETEYWMPVHKLVAPALEKDLKPGDQIGVYYFYLGGFNPRDLQKKESNKDKSAPIEEDSFRWIFAIEKFEKPRPSPFVFRALDSVIDKSMEAPGKISDIWYDPRQVKSQAKLKFTGDFREISGKRKQLLNLWFEKNGFPDGASALMAKEARFTDGDKEYWIGMRNTTLTELIENVRKGIWLCLTQSFQAELEITTESIGFFWRANSFINIQHSGLKVSKTMSNYTAQISWKNNSPETFTKNRYTRGHTWTFDGGIEVPASSSPHAVRVPFSVEQAVDPEEALVASASSCHMLTFLWIAAKRGFLIDSYEDNAVGEMTKNENGIEWMSKITLDPKIAWSGEKLPTDEELAEMHHAAHEQCYIANSVKSEIVLSEPGAVATGSQSEPPASAGGFLLSDPGAVATGQ